MSHALPSAKPASILTRRLPHWTDTIFGLGAAILVPLLNLVILPGFECPCGFRANFGWEGIIVSLTALVLVGFPFFCSRTHQWWWCIIRTLSFTFCLFCFLMTVESYVVAKYLT